MAHWKNARLPIVFCLVLFAAACSSKSPSVSSTAGPSGTLPAPAIDAPSDDQQLDTIRPTLVLRNSAASGSGVRTYDFQVSLNSSFSPVTASKLSVVENPSGKTSATIDVDLQPSTRFFWRARMVQGGAASDWIIGKFRTKLGGYNRPGELYDILSDGFTVGERVGDTTFVPGKGIKINNYQSYVRYQLPQTVPAGEFSVEVEGLAPGGSRPKGTIFSMAEGTGNLTGTNYEFFAAYRGLAGNPDNCISYKAVINGSVVEFDRAGRESAVMSLNPGTTYLWQATWSGNSFRVVIKAGGANGSVIYDRTLSTGGGSAYSPNPHVAYIGANSTDGSYPGMIVRNVWLGSRPRPASAATAFGR